LDETLPSPWDTFQKLQAASNSPRVTARTNARDEALTELLEELGTAGQLSLDAAAMARRYRALSANRSKKYRYRVELADQVAHHQQHEHLGPDSLGLAELREQADRVLADLAPRDQDLLRQIFGYGRSYREIASRQGQPVGTVKARVSRLRDQIRGRVTGSTLVGAAA